MVPYLALYTCLYFTQLVAGFQGIRHGVGILWAIVALVANAYRLSLPMEVGAYWHAMTAWGWHPAFAVLFATGPLTWLGVEQFTSWRRFGFLWQRCWLKESIWILSFTLLRCLHIAVLVAGFQGIRHGVGIFWAIVAFFANAYGWGLPMAVGAYVHATGAWNWQPAMAMLFAAGPAITLLVRRFCL